MADTTPSPLTQALENLAVLQTARRDIEQVVSQATAHPLHGSTHQLMRTWVDRHTEPDRVAQQALDLLEDDLVGECP